jgi:imidazolonepropionase-like amidohydrolase
VVEEARAQGLRVVGHVDRQVGLARALEAGQQIEHLDGYLEAILADSAPERGSVSGVYVWQPRAWATVDHLDFAKIPEVARATAAAGVFSTPTLTFLKRAFGTGQSDQEIRARPDWRLLPASLREEMEGPRARFWGSPPSPERRARYVEARNRMTAAIHAAGGRIMAGSDAPEWFLMTGFTLHRELESLVAAGLSPYAALEAATRTPAEWIALPGRTGTVAVGAPADLVLLDANPLEDIRNTQRIHAVMLGGRYLDRAALDGLIRRAEERIGRLP